MTKSEEVVNALAPMFRCPLCETMILATRYADGNRPSAAAGRCDCPNPNGTGRWDKFGDLDEWMAAGQP